MRVTLIVSPLSSFGDDGVPGLRSTKKLPSRKMRGRILAVASSWIGSPLSLISIVTSAWSVPSLGLTDLTLPTLTPAIRTGELTRSELADSNTALTRNPLRERDVLGEAEEDGDEDDRERDQPDGERAAPERAAAGDGHYFVPSVGAGCLPGTLPITLRPTRNGSLPASHSFGWPGEAVFGYGLECR